MKRIKRKQLKEDEFVTTVNKIVRLVKERKKELIAFAVVVAVVVVVFFGVQFVKGLNRGRERRLLTQILDLYSGLSTKPENEGKLEGLAGGGKFSRLAYLLLANHWVEKGEDAKAQGFLEKMPEGQKDIFYYQAKDLLAQIYLRQKNYDKALDIYKKIEEENPKDYSLDVVLFHRAEVYEKKGEAGEALTLYKRVQNEFPQTYYGFDASQKVMELQAQK